MSLRLSKFMPFFEKYGNRGPYGPKICDLWPIFQLFQLTEPKTLCTGNAARSKNVMFLSKNVMSFFLRGPMNTSHTFGKRTELYSNFYAGSPAP